jgi:hypothetical protein
MEYYVAIFLLLGKKSPNFEKKMLEFFWGPHLDFDLIW